MKTLTQNEICKALRHAMEQMQVAEEEGGAKDFMTAEETEIFCDWLNSNEEAVKSLKRSIEEQTSKMPIYSLVDTKTRHITAEPYSAMSNSFFKLAMKNCDALSNNFEDMYTVLTMYQKSLAVYSTAVIDRANYEKLEKCVSTHLMLLTYTTAQTLDFEELLTELDTANEQIIQPIRIIVSELHAKFKELLNSTYRIALQLFSSDNRTVFHASDGKGDATDF